MSSVDLVPVVLLGVPVARSEAAQEHFDELLREFLLLAQGDEAVSRDVPGRLLALSDDLRNRFSSFSEANAALLDEAATRGDESVDLRFEVPSDAAAAARQLGDLLDEADAYCSRGEYLLTLRTPTSAVEYRNWYLGQFVEQIDGRPPTAFPDWLRDRTT